MMESRFARLAADVDGCPVEGQMQGRRRLPPANHELAPPRNPGLPTRPNAWADGPMKTATSSSKILLGMPSLAQPRPRPPSRPRPRPPPPPPERRISPPLDLQQISSQRIMLSNPSPAPSCVPRRTQSRGRTSSLSSLSPWRLRPPPPGPAAGEAPTPHRSGHRPAQGRM